jgi:phosphatidylglycerol lysyltransferase
LHIDEGMKFFAEKPRAMIGPLAWIFLDWVCTIGVLYAAFYSVGSDVSYGDVVIAFSVGIVVAVVSFVPGGIGVLDGTLFAMFARTGIPDEQIVLALMIFRVSFYVIPVMLSLVVARSAFADVDASGTEEFV